MQMQLQPNRWSCLPTSFAMTLGTSVSNLIKKLDHDGSKIVKPELGEPDCRLGFHVQELIDICYDLGYAVIPIEGKPVLGIDVIFNTNKSIKRFEKYLYNNIGVITGEIHNKKHAVAWSGEKIYDPNGLIYSIDQFVIETLWLIKKFKSNQTIKFI